MKIRIIMLLAAVFFSLTACSEGRQNLINAENYEGMPIVSKSSTVPIGGYNKKSTSEKTDKIRIDKSKTSQITAETSELPPTPTGTTASHVEKTSVSTRTAKTSSTPPIETGEIPKTVKSTQNPVQSTATSASSPSTTAVERQYLNNNTTYGIWISYLEIGGILMGKSEEYFRSEFALMMSNCKDFGINTVYIQARPFGDALYPSELFPWSKYASGNFTVSPNFDPLKVMIEEARKKNMSVHGWINPLRLSPTPDMIKLGNEYKTGEWYNSEKNGEYVVKSGDNWYLNPAYDEVQKLIADGAYEIVSRYDVDGLQIDDYFYPTTESGFDEIAFKASGKSSLSDFRRDNINKLIKDLNKAVKKANSNVLFGISPQGNIENNFNNLYADVTLWGGSKDYCDYIIPQIYYGFSNQSQPYEECLLRWVNITKNSGVKLIPGLAAYKIGREDKWAGKGINEWINNSDILSRQISAAAKNGINGAAFFSYNYLFGAESKYDAVRAEKNAIKKEIG